MHSALLSSYSREGTRSNVHNLPSLFDIGLTDLAEGLGENVSSCPLVPTAQCTHVKEEERKASSQPLTLAWVSTRIRNGEFFSKKKIFTWKAYWLFFNLTTFLSTSRLLITYGLSYVPYTAFTFLFVPFTQCFFTFDHLKMIPNKVFPKFEICSTYMKFIHPEVLRLKANVNLCKCTKWQPYFQTSF